MVYPVDEIWVAEPVILGLSLQEEHLPSSHVHPAVGTPPCHDMD